MRTVADRLRLLPGTDSQGSPYRCDEAEECVAVAERAVERSRELEEQFSEGEVSDEARRELDDLDNLVREKVELLTEIKVHYLSRNCQTFRL